MFAAERWRKLPKRLDAVNQTKRVHQRSDFSRLRRSNALASNAACGEPALALRPLCRAQPRLNRQLGQHGRDVVVDRAHRTVQAGGDVGIAQVLGHQRQHVQLGARQAAGVAALVGGPREPRPPAVLRCRLQRVRAPVRRGSPAPARRRAAARSPRAKAASERAAQLGPRRCSVPLGAAMACASSNTLATPGSPRRRRTRPSASRALSDTAAAHRSLERRQRGVAFDQRVHGVHPHSKRSGRSARGRPGEFMALAAPASSRPTPPRRSPCQPAAGPVSSATAPSLPCPSSPVAV